MKQPASGLPAFAPLGRAAVARETLECIPFGNEPALEIGLEVHAVDDVVKRVGFPRRARTIDVQVKVPLQRRGSDNADGFDSPDE
jgi:hypothetical protein